MTIRLHRRRSGFLAILRTPDKSSVAHAGFVRDSQVKHVGRTEQTVSLPELRLAVWRGPLNRMSIRKIRFALFRHRCRPRSGLTYCTMQARPTAPTADVRKSRRRNDGATGHSGHAPSRQSLSVSLSTLTTVCRIFCRFHVYVMCTLPSGP